MNLLKGIDVSDAQGESIDWVRVKRAGIDFVYVKATEGGDWTSKTFTAKRRLAIRAAGLAFGPFHYLRPRRSRRGRDEAAHCLSVIQRVGWKPGPDLPVMVDTEWIGNEAELRAMTSAQLNAYVSDFCGYMHEKTGRGCVDYLSTAFAAELGGKAPAWGGVAMVADWDAPDGRPHVPAGFKPSQVRFHQVSDRAHVDGIPGVVDLDLFLGNFWGLEAFINDRPMPKQPAKPQPVHHDKLPTRPVQQLLRRIGWPIKVDGIRGPQTIGALMDFQGGYARGQQRLSRTGISDQRTVVALQWSAAHGGRCSANFFYREFRSRAEHCHGNGWIKVDRDLVRGLESYRKLVGHSISVVSGYRDSAKNHCEGGASLSQHLYGNAVDLVPEITVARACTLRAFSGIGFQGSSGLVRHVDVRHRGPNTTGGSVVAPTIWRYS